MQIFTKVLTVLLYTGAAFMAGMLVSQFSQYALWVLIYTGAAFMGGLWFGQRWERSWGEQQEITEENSTASDLDRSTNDHTETDIRKPTGLRI